MAPRARPKADTQSDLFTTVYADIPIRDQRDTMERPFFSLAKKPRTTPIGYEVGGVKVRVSPNKEHGIATIWDADILIWAASQVTEALDRGDQPSRTLRFPPYNLLKAIRRGTSGREYERLRAAMRRLAATYVETNIRTKNKKGGGGFHWLEAWSEELDDEGNPTGMTMTLPDWLFEGVVSSGGVLTIHEDYFLLTGGIERWLYRVARKHAGHQETGWQFTMRQLYEKSGSTARPTDFAIDVRGIVERDELPEYALEITKNVEGDEVVHFQPRHLLDFRDPRYQPPRHTRRRMSVGIASKLTL